MKNDRPVTIVGLLPRQQRLAQRKLPDIHLRFLKHEITPREVPGSGEVILMIKFLKHAVYFGLPARPGLHRLYGGIASLVSLVRSLSEPRPCQAERS